MIYFDGCYVAKFYLAEPDSPQVTAAAITAGGVGSCLHGRLEVMSVFHRKLREGIMDRSGYDLVRNQFERDNANGLWTWFPLSFPSVEQACSRFGTLPSTRFLRAGDALHLATAVEHGFSEIYTSDRHLLAAAPYFGLTGVCF